MPLDKETRSWMNSFGEDDDNECIPLSESLDNQGSDSSPAPTESDNGGGSGNDDDGGGGDGDGEDDDGDGGHWVASLTQIYGYNCEGSLPVQGDTSGHCHDSPFRGDHGLSAVRVDPEAYGQESRRGKKSSRNTRNWYEYEDSSSSVMQSLSDLTLSDSSYGSGNENYHSSGYPAGNYRPYPYSYSPQHYPPPLHPQDNSLGLLNPNNYLTLHTYGEQPRQDGVEFGTFTYMLPTGWNDDSGSNQDQSQSQCLDPPRRSFWW